MSAFQAGMMQSCCYLAPKKTLIKGTVTQIKKALIIVRLRVSKVS